MTIIGIIYNLFNDVIILGDVLAHFQCFWIQRDSLESALDEAQQDVAVVKTKWEEALKNKFDIKGKLEDAQVRSRYDSVYILHTVHLCSAMLSKLNQANRNEYFQVERIQLCCRSDVEFLIGYIDLLGMMEEVIPASLQDLVKYTSIPLTRQTTNHQDV